MIPIALTSITIAAALAAAVVFALRPVRVPAITAGAEAGAPARLRARSRAWLALVAGIACAAAVAGPGVPAASAAAGDDVLAGANPGFETANATADAPAGWTKGGFGTNASSLTLSPDAHTGTYSARIEVTAYTDGDVKLVPDSLVPVTPDTNYVISDWYKSDVSTAVSVFYQKSGETGDTGHWANLDANIPAASAWTQFSTTFTMPHDAVRAYFVHRIAAVGFLQTDDYSMKEIAPPPGFDKPIISLTFDDGKKTFTDNARAVLDAKGFKTTQYIPTTFLGADDGRMTAAEVSELAASGHEIESHTVNHVDLSRLFGASLATEFTESKATLEGIAGVGTVSDMAYPFGSYNADVVAAAKAAGYRSGRSVEPGYNAKGQIDPYDIRVQNITSTTTPAEFQSWIDYAKRQNYWLVIVYHNVQPDSATLGADDTKKSDFQAQLDYIADQGLGPNVMTMRQALTAVGLVRAANPAPATPTPAPTTTATPTTGTSSGRADKTPPKIAVSSPKARRYKVGQSLKIKIFCTDGSGSVQWKATVRRGGTRARTVKQGTKLRLSRAGSYVLRVTATDRWGNSATKEVRFRVVRK